MNKGSNQKIESREKISKSQIGKRRKPYNGSFLWKLENISEENILNAIISSFSIKETCEKLNLKLNGSAYNAFKVYLKDHDHDYSHFLGKKSNFGKRHKGRKARTPEEILVLRDKKAGTHSVRYALLKIGREYICEICKITPIWNGKKLVLQVDHKSGNRLDDRQQNVRFLCPNCHSQTETFTGKNIKR